MFVGTFDHISDFFGGAPRPTARSRFAGALSQLRAAFAPDPLRAVDRHMARDIGLETDAAPPACTPRLGCARV